MLINYRFFTLRAMVDILTSDGVYFSRGDFFDRGSLEQRDIITLRKEDAGEGRGPALVIEAACYSNLDGAAVQLGAKGFVRDAAAACYRKQWFIEYRSALSAAKLAEKVLAGLSAAAEEMPLLLYASPAFKALAAYQAFMNSSLVKVGLNDVMRRLGYRDRRGMSAAEAAETAGECLLASYDDERWAAWVSGDQIVPLFASEAEARRFLRQRTRGFDRSEQTVRLLTPLPKSDLPNLYVLIDHSAGVWERMDWLQCELERLAGYAGRAGLRRRLGQLEIKSVSTR